MYFTLTHAHTWAFGTIIFAHYPAQRLACFHTCTLSHSVGWLPSPLGALTLPAAQVFLASCALVSCHASVFTLSRETYAVSGTPAWRTGMAVRPPSPPLSTRTPARSGTHPEVSARPASFPRLTWGRTGPATCLPLSFSHPGHTLAHTGTHLWAPHGCCWALGCGGSAPGVRHMHDGL